VGNILGNPTNLWEKCHFELPKTKSMTQASKEERKLLDHYDHEQMIVA